MWTQITSKIQVNLASAYLGVGKIILACLKFAQVSLKFWNMSLGKTVMAGVLHFTKLQKFTFIWFLTTLTQLTSLNSLKKKTKTLLQPQLQPLKMQ